MRCTAMLVCLLGVALAVPHCQAKEEDALPQGKQEVDIWPSLSHLVHQFRDYIIHREKQLDVMTILHLLGISDEDLINAVDYFESIVAEVAEDMTPEEKFKFVNAGMDILLMLKNDNFNVDAALGDLHTIKTVLYPHLNEHLQKILDIIEQVIIIILKIFGTA